MSNPSMTAGRPSARTGKPGKTIDDLREPKVRINGDISRDLHQKIKIQAVLEGVTMTDLLSKSLTEYLSKHGNTRIAPL
jgi:hypothetical protein